MTSTLMIVLGLVAILAVCFAVAWYVDHRRAHRWDHDNEHPVDVERMHSDEEQFSEYSTDPRTRMR